MRTREEIEEELRKLYKGREWREKNGFLTDMGMVVNGKFVPPRRVLVEFEKAEERIETLEWVLDRKKET